jgi:hypothetical protein
LCVSFSSAHLIWFVMAALVKNGFQIATQWWKPASLVILWTWSSVTLPYALLHPYMAPIYACGYHEESYNGPVHSQCGDSQIEEGNFECYDFHCVKQYHKLQFLRPLWFEIFNHKSSSDHIVGGFYPILRGYIQ